MSDSTNANDILGEVGEDEIRTFADNINVELANRANEMGFCAHDLPHDASCAIIDLVLERAAEVFVAYSESFQPGSAFMPFHVATFLRELKTDESSYRPDPTPAESGCESDSGDSEPNV